MVRNEEPDPENDEIPEESIEDYCDRYGIRFDEGGNISGYVLPAEIEEAVYRQRQRNYLRQDVRKIAEDVLDSEMLPKITDEFVEYVIDLYLYEFEDSNRPFNDTMEEAIIYVLKVETEDEESVKKNI
jgi:hypothetical protein